MNSDQLDLLINQAMLLCSAAAASGKRKTIIRVSDPKLQQAVATELNSLALKVSVITPTYIEFQW